MAVSWARRINQLQISSVYLCYHHLDCTLPTPERTKNPITPQLNSNGRDTVGGGGVSSKEGAWLTLLPWKHEVEVFGVSATVLEPGLEEVLQAEDV